MVQHHRPAYVDTFVPANTGAGRKLRHVSRAFAETFVERRRPADAVVFRKGGSVSI